MPDRARAQESDRPAASAPTEDVVRRPGPAAVDAFRALTAAGNGAVVRRLAVPGPADTLPDDFGARHAAALRESAPPLPADLLSSAERTLGPEVHDVRVHRGPAAGAAAASIGAAAYSAGRHVVVPGDAPAADTPSGRALLGHELAHAAGGGDSAPTRLGGVAEPAETHADLAARHISSDSGPAASGPSPVAASPVVRRQPLPDGGVATLPPERMVEPAVDPEEGLRDAGAPVAGVPSTPGPDAAPPPDAPPPPPTAPGPPTPPSAPAPDAGVPPGGGPGPDGGAPASTLTTPEPGVDAGPTHPGASALPAEALPVLPATGIDPVLVDEELAEHERWGAAAATVGGGGSADRAGWIAEQAGAGFGTGFFTGAGAGVVLAIGTRAGTRLAARRIPVPVVGAIIGGAIGAASLYGQLGAEGRAELAAKFAAFGEGASGYEVAANTIDAIVTGLDLAGNILDTVGLVAGVVAAVAWALALPTLGASTAVAAPATSIATAASASAAVLGIVKLLLQPLVLLFRSLHTFTSEADPRAVQAQGTQLATAAGALGGVLGGFAGTAVGNRASDRLGMPEDPTRATRIEETGGGEGGRVAGHPQGPQVEAAPTERLVLSPEEVRVAEAQARNPNPVVVGPDGRPPSGSPDTGRPVLFGADDRPLEPVGPAPTVLGPDGAGPPPPPPPLSVGRRLVPTIQDDVRDPSSVRPRTIFDPEPTSREVEAALGFSDPNVPRNLVIDPANPPGAPPLGYGHGYVVDAEGREVPAQFGPFRGEVGSPVVDPVTGQRVWAPEAAMHIPALDPNGPPEAAFTVRAGPPGSWGDAVFRGSREDALREAARHAAARALAGEGAIRGDSALPHGWMGSAPGQVPPTNYPIERMNIYEIDPGTPSISSVVAPQPEGLPGPGRPDVYQGGGPQVQLPFGTIPRDARPAASFRVHRPGFGERVLAGPVGDIDDANDAASLAQLVTGSPSAGPAAVPTDPGALVRPGGGGGPAAARRQVVPVNPDYERPPGTPAELAAMRREIAAILFGRAQAQADADAADVDRAQTDHRAAQLMSVSADVERLGQRTAEQRRDVDTTTEANRAQQGRQGEVGTAVAASASRLAGLATLELLLAGWEAVTRGVGAAISLVSDDGAAKMNRLNADARRFMAQLAQAKMLVSGQNSQHPLQLGRLTGDAGTLRTESTRTTGTQADVDRSRAQVAALRGQNARDAAAADDGGRRAEQDAAEATDAAAAAQARHDRLAADLNAWAQRHHEQRRLAIAQTCDRLTAQGYEVLDAPTW